MLRTLSFLLIFFFLVTTSAQSNPDSCDDVVFTNIDESVAIVFLSTGDRMKFRELHKGAWQDCFAARGFKVGQYYAHCTSDPDATWRISLYGDNQIDKVQYGTHLLRRQCGLGRRPANVLNLPTAEPQLQTTHICRAGIAQLFGRSPNIIQHYRTEGDVIFLKYIRSDDNTVWRYKCRIAGYRIMWGADDGRWRTHPMDEVVMFDIHQNSVTVRTTLSDGSQSGSRNYSFAELGVR